MDKKIVQIRLTPEEYERLVKLAQKERRSLANMVRTLIMREEKN